MAQGHAQNAPLPWTRGRRFRARRTAPALLGCAGDGSRIGGKEGRWHMGLSRVVGIVATLLACLGAGSALAADPAPWETGFQPAATPVMARIESLNTGVTIIIVLIGLLVLGLLTYVIARFNHRTNPNPSRTTHNTVVEMLCHPRAHFWSREERP